MSTLILVRHGQSQWNLENRFTGWVDVDLTDVGREEARSAGYAIRAANLAVRRCFVSPLKRAQETAALLREASGQQFTFTEAPEIIERFYGGLTGLNKAETAAEYGEDQVHLWRRSYDIAPPALTLADDRHPNNNPSYAKFPFTLPATESLKDVVDRVTPFYNNILKPLLRGDDVILLVAHGNSIRALIKEIKGLDEAGIQQVEIATGKPLVLTLDDQHQLISERTL